ncbi:MAG TPA: DUF2231 domain-containing protein [Mycobacteriales bacterium]|nr:DUF2231 domain-containing protein [Mycobacteriales bacterium]
MPATVGNLPLHPLLVHAVVVLVPLAVVAAVAMAVSARVRDRFGWLFLGLTTAALVSVPLATSTGEALQARVQMTEAIEEHAELGDQLLPIAGLLWVAVCLLMVAHRWSTSPVNGPGTLARTAAGGLLAPLDRLGRRVGVRTSSRVRLVAAAVAVLMAAVTGVQVYRIGDSGARAVWHGVGTGAPLQQGDED